ncbi:MAG: hypothetical protein Q8R92_19445, partial [Deltaproteobacteria bacterium]|nr:hypothetical protein [Deltaproteobacteria bacterium]
VDYTRPGFAVVYLEGEPPPAGTLRINLDASRLGPRMEPMNGAVGLGGKVIVRNETSEPHIVSCPELNFLKRVSPGDEASIDTVEQGSHRVFMLDAPAVSATFFVAPGPFTVVGSDGRWQIEGVNPGVKKLRAWHPRFPPSLREVEAPGSKVIEVNLELAVDEPASL